MLANILLTLFFTGLIWLMYRGIKNNPQLFSKANLSQSFTTMGILALILIAVIGSVIVLLRQSR